MFAMVLYWFLGIGAIVAGVLGLQFRKESFFVAASAGAILTGLTAMYVELNPIVGLALMIEAILWLGVGYMVRLVSV